MMLYQMVLMMMKRTAILVQPIQLALTMVKLMGWKKGEQQGQPVSHSKNNLVPSETRRNLHW